MLNGLTAAWIVCHRHPFLGAAVQVVPPDVGQLERPPVRAILQRHLDLPVADLNFVHHLDGRRRSNAAALPCVLGTTKVGRRVDCVGHRRGQPVIERGTVAADGRLERADVGGDALKEILGGVLERRENVASVVVVERRHLQAAG